MILKKVATDNRIISNSNQELFLPSFSPWTVSDAALPALRDRTPSELLLHRAWTEVLAPSQKQGISGIQPLGFHPIFDHIRMVEARDSDWLIFPMEKDPIYQSGKFPMPRRVLEHFRAVDASGASFDTLYVAHELPKDLLKQGDDAAVLRAIAPPPPEDVAQLSARLGRVSLGTLLGAFGIPWRQVAEAGLALGGAAVAAVSFLALDPIIFGVIAPRQPARVGDPAFFFVLASWRWGRDNGGL